MKKTKYRRKIKEEPSPKKVSIINVFNQETEIKISMINSNLTYNESEKRAEDFKAILECPVVSIEDLQAHSWNGIPASRIWLILGYRSQAWKILLRYCPTNKETREYALTKKRKDYFAMVDTYI